MPDKNDKEKNDKLPPERELPSDEKTPPEKTDAVANALAASMKQENLDILPPGVSPRNIEDEMKTSFIDYSMSVIMSRALPDIRDGLKPVHRRILFTMKEMGLRHSTAYKKSARVVGDCLGKYHPHGDMAVYDSMVRMAQDFSLRYPLVEGQGNFGSIDGDSPAAMRYTEVRLASISEEMLGDLDKETVDFMPNYDGSMEEPVILPAKLPNLLINGSAGIAVGMATNIPPHNLTEVLDGISALIENRDITIAEIGKIIKGPDFPTAGILYGRSGIKNYFETGRGSVKIRAKAEVEGIKGNRQAIIINELPYQVNKANLLETIADLVRDKKLDDISDLRDESDRDGMRVVIELKRDANAQVVLNQLFKHTQMQVSFGVIMLSIVDGKPRVLNIKQMLENYIAHRKIIVVRRTRFELKKAETRAHILEGLKIALDHLDAVIKTIKESKDVENARERLMEKFKLSKIQAQAILDMKLQQLTNLERKKIDDEYLELIKLIEKLKSILADPKKVLSVIKTELEDLREKYGDERRTRIIAQAVELDEEDLIPHEEVAVTISHAGYIKRIPLSTYRAQGRGGRGVTGMTTKEEDFVEDLFSTDTHAYLLLFTSRGRCYWLRVYEIPEGNRASKGKAIVNFISASSEERVTSTIPIQAFDGDKEKGTYLLMCTRNGTIKKTPLSEYSNPRKGGIIAINLEQGDELMDVKRTDGKSEAIIATADGIAIRFKETDVRSMGRASKGVRGIKLDKTDTVVGMEVVGKDDIFLTASENGYGKRTEVGKYRLQTRGGKGVKNMKTTDRNGRVIGVKKAMDTDDVMLMTQKGITIRLACKAVSVIGRNVQGVRLVRLEEGDRLAAIATVIKEENGNGDSAGDVVEPAQ
jgi:DNA gyrase subunit A